MRLDKLHNLFEETLRKAIDSKNLSNDEINKATQGISQCVPKVIQEIADLLYPSLLQMAPSMLNEKSEFIRDFESEHQELWGNALDLLDAFLVASFEAGDHFNNHYREDATNTKDYLFIVLTRLHARAVQVGNEVLTLLKAGYADGAHARWRTAHELGVISNFIYMHGPEIAKRYLEHEVVESYKALVQFQEHAVKLGYEPYSEDYVQNVKAYRDNLCEQYGESFKNGYGWASEILSNNNPTFSQIEKAVELDHIRPYYKMASHNVHANPKGTSFRLGLLDNYKILLAGPSVYGLADPAHGVSISILQTNVSMLNSKPTIDSLVIGTVLYKFVDDIGEAFIKVNEHINNE